MEAEIKIVENIEAVWPRMVKNNVSVHTLTNHKLVGLAVEHQHFKLILIATIGKRGGLKEEVLVIDSSRPVLVDRLHLSMQDQFDGRILPLRQMRNEMRHAADPIGIVVTFMEQALNNIRTSPEQYFREATLPRLGLVSISVDAISGGAWGTKR